MKKLLVFGLYTTAFPPSNFIFLLVTNILVYLFLFEILVIYSEKWKLIFDFENSMAYLFG